MARATAAEAEVAEQEAELRTLRAERDAALAAHAAGLAEGDSREINDCDGVNGLRLRSDS